jgi:hypothetical protein
MIPYRALAAAMAVGLAVPTLASAAKSSGIVRITVIGAGGPPRQDHHTITLVGVAVRVTTRTAIPVAGARTGSNGTATLHLAPGRYVVNGFLVPPAVIPERRCEAKPKPITVRAGKVTTVSIACPIR